MYSSIKRQAKILRLRKPLQHIGDRKDPKKRGRPRKPIVEVNGVVGRQCARCKKMKTLDEFYRNKRPPRYFKSYCRSCHNEINLERYRRLIK